MHYARIKGVLHDHNETCGWALLLSTRMEEEVVQRCLRSDCTLTYADLRPPRALLLFLLFCFGIRPPCDTTIHHDDGEKEENRKTTNRRVIMYLVDNSMQQYTTTAASISSRVPIQTQSRINAMYSSCTVYKHPNQVMCVCTAQYDIIRT